MSETDDRRDRLLQMASEAADGAYAPYSGYRVGAALEAGSGRVYTGANIENAAYSVSICAERAALARAVSAGERSFVSIAVVAADGSDAPPCGSCRQALVEFSPGMEVIYRSGGSVRKARLDQLLPDAFRGGGREA